MCDPRIASNKRLEAIKRFLKMSSCCLDTGFGRKLLKRFKNLGPLSMLQPKVQRFLVAFFNSIVLSTAFLECGFAKSSSWLPRRSRPLSVAHLNSKWLLSELTMIRDAAQSKLSAGRRLCRPSWATPLSKRNGYHFWSKGKGQDALAAHMAGESLAPSADEKKKWAERARRFNRQQSLTRRINQLAEREGYKDALSRSSCRDGLFDMGDARTAFGVGELCDAGYEQDTAFVTKSAGRWERKAGDHCKRDPRVPRDTIPVEDVCGELCSDNVKISELPIHKLCKELVGALELIMLHLLEQSPDNDMPIIHLEFADRAGNISNEWWQCICYWKPHAGHKFEAVLISYLISSLEPGGQLAHPYEIQVKQPTRLGWQGFDADVFRSVAFRMARQYVGCSFVINSVATARCGDHFDTLCAVSSSRCDLDEIAQSKETEMDLKSAVDACCRKRKMPQAEHSRRGTAKRAKGLMPPKHSHLTKRALKHSLQDIPFFVESSSRRGKCVYSVCVCVCVLFWLLLLSLLLFLLLPVILLPFDPPMKSFKTK